MKPDFCQTTLLKLLAATLLGVVPISLARGQTTKAIDVNEARPLWYALDALEDIVGRVVNYEDPPYQNYSGPGRLLDCRTKSG